VHSKFSEWFLDFSPVKLAACLKPPTRANHRTIMAYWKDATTPQPTTCDRSHRKNEVWTFSVPLLKLCNRGGMKSSKMSQGRNAYKEKKRLGTKYHKGRNKAIKILNVKIPTDPYKMAIFPIGNLYSLQKPKNIYCRNFSLRVATLTAKHLPPWLNVHLRRFVVMLLLRNKGQ